MSKKPYVPPSEDYRAAALSEARRTKMARSAHAYVRGNTAQFYEWLGGITVATVPEGPAIWICGDCHLGNLGPVADAEGRVEIQIRDLDQTVIGNPAHDLIRLSLSLASAARGCDLPGLTTVRMVERAIEGYETALESDDLSDAFRPDSVKLVLKRALGRTWKHLARERVRDVSPTIPLGRRFWPLSAEERSTLLGLFGTETMRRLATSLKSRPDDAPVEVMDAAYWKKGCSSLGRVRFAVLVRVGNKGSESDLCLMDVKEAAQAAAPRQPGADIPLDNAERVVEGARHLAPYLGERMRPAKLLDRSVFVRELRPQDLKLAVDEMTETEAERTAHFLAAVVGRAHARQMSPPSRRRWLAELRRNRTKSLDAPSWLWKTVVALLGAHEAAYLEHCRKYSHQLAQFGEAEGRLLPRHLAVGATRA